MEHSPFYDMLVNMWVLGTVTRDELEMLTPEYISEEELEMILEMEQDGVIPMEVSLNNVG